jgi:hypothetical protein
MVIGSLNLNALGREEYPNGQEMERGEPLPEKAV